jgi:protein-S-isoprenylcysteine O-methyltransferase Ste14
MLVAVFMLLMFVLGLTKPLLAFSLPYSSVLSLAIFIAGALVIAIGGYSFRRAKTTFNPLTPEETTRLVTSGIYALSRNPMYIGYLLWLMACAVYIGSLLNLLLLPLFVYLVNRLYIYHEEKALINLFGDEFATYTSKVRRWL